MAKFAAKDSNKNITLSPHGTGKVVVGTGAANATVESDGNHHLVLQTGNATTGSITVGNGANGDIGVVTNGTGKINLTADVVLGDSSDTLKAHRVSGPETRSGTGSNSEPGSNLIVSGGVGTGTANNGDLILQVGNTANNGNQTPHGKITGLTVAKDTANVTIPTLLNVDNVAIDGNAITSTNTDGNIDLTPNGTGEVNISKVDIDSGTIDGTTIATSNVTVGAGKTLDVSAGTFTTSTAQKQAISSTAFASGTRMMFQQGSAPTGWTKETSSFNDYMLRLTTGTPANYTSGNGVSGNVGTTTLSTSQTPYMQVVHQQDGVGTPPAPSFSTIYASGTTFGVCSSQLGISTGSQGVNTSGSCGYYNRIVINNGGGSHSHDLNINYVDIIIAQKD